MATSEQIDSFTRFARELSVKEGAELPLDVIFDRWREEAFRDEDLLRIQASVNDFEHGERGRPVADVLTDLDALRRTDKT